MPHFRVDDALHSHPKPQRAGDEAIGLWVRAGSYCMAYLTDGFVPEWWVKQQPKGIAKARKLVETGLWHDGAERDGERGYLFHEFVGPGRQDSREKIEADRELARKRKQKSRRESQEESHQESQRDTHRDRQRESQEESRRSPGYTQPNPTQPINGTHLGGESPVSNARDDEPPRRCPKHEDVDDPPLCGACAEARRANDKWHLAKRKADTERANAEAAQRRRDEAAARRAAIDSCPIGCDDDGYRDGQVCHHNPDQADTNRRGAELLRSVMAGETEPPEIEDDPDR